MARFILSDFTFAELVGSWTREFYSKIEISVSLFQHFVCARCEKPFLGTRHYEKKGLAYCEMHYHQVGRHLLTYWHVQNRLCPSHNTEQWRPIATLDEELHVLHCLPTERSLLFSEHSTASLFRNRVVLTTVLADQLFLLTTWRQW